MKRFSSSYLASAFLPDFSGCLCILALCMVVTLPSAPLEAQAPETPKNVNLIRNGNFENFGPRPSLWYGVDSDGNLAGMQGRADVLAKSGNVTNMAMPVSVCMGDINGDGLPDLITADAAGYLRVYLNSGTKTEPKFSHCEIIPFFLARYKMQRNDPDSWRELTRYRLAQRINLYDWSRRGMLDLMIGDDGGQLFLFPNMGSAASPSYRQPLTAEDGLLQTAPGGALWGTLFSPIAYDWSRSGKTDLLVGEGSYSANAVHLFVNQGSGAKPDFRQESRYYLAYGDGREQLVPTVADFNGDGKPDLLVADREGTVGAYLNSGSWKPGEELKFSKMVDFGGTTSFGSPITIYAADYNGDGLFDLIIGKGNGRIQVAINRGTKDQPKFDAPIDIKGDAEWSTKAPVNAPAAWQCDASVSKGNAYGYFSVVGPAEDKDATSPHSAHVLKAAYFPCPNKVFKQPDLNLDGLPLSAGKDLEKNTMNDLIWADPHRLYNLQVGSADARVYWTSTRMFMLHATPSAQLKVGSTYTLSFNVKGKGIKESRWVLAYGGHKVNAPEKIRRGERGSAVVAWNHVNEMNTDATANFNAGTSWTNVSHTFTVKFKDPRFKGMLTTNVCVLEISFLLAPYDGVLYIDDVQLLEKP